MSDLTAEKQLLSLHKLGYNIIRLHGIEPRSGDGKMVCTCGDVFCSKPGKHPVSSWIKSAEKPMTAVQIKSWLTTQQACNWGILTGDPSGVSIIDIDKKSGGFESLEKMGLKYPDAWFATPIVETGGGGIHIYVRTPDDPDFKTTSNIAPGIDIRHNGGIAVIPPSSHISGVNYSWKPGHAPWEIPIHEFDARMFLERVESIREKDPSKKKGQKTSLFSKIASGVHEGYRNDTMTQLVGHFMGKNLPDDEIFYLVSKMNSDFFKPPLVDVELWTIISSIRRGEMSQESNNIDPEDVKESIVQYLGLNKTISSDKRPVKLESITQSSGEDLIYLFEFHVGSEVVEIKMTSPQLHTPSVFTRILSDRLRRVPRKLGDKTVPSHSNMVNHILSIVEVKDPGFAGTAIGEALINIEQYVRQSIVTKLDDDFKRVPDRGSLEIGDFFWISLGEFANWANSRTATKYSPKQLSSLLTLHGYKRVIFTNEQGGSRTLYGISKEQILRVTEDAEDRLKPTGD